MKCQNDDLHIILSDAVTSLRSPLPIFDRAGPRHGVRNMKIDDETTFSLRVSWQPVDSRNVRQYRLSYISMRGDRATETVRLAERLDFIPDGAVISFECLC